MIVEFKNISKTEQAYLSTGQALVSQSIGIQRQLVVDQICMLLQSLKRATNLAIHFFVLETFIK